MGKMVKDKDIISCLGYFATALGGKYFLKMDNRTFSKWAQLALCQELNDSMLKALMITLNMHNVQVTGYKWRNTSQAFLMSRLRMSRKGAYKVMEKLIKIGLVNKQTNAHSNALHYSPILDNIYAMIAKNEMELKNATFPKYEYVQQHDVYDLPKYEEKPQRVENKTVQNDLPFNTMPQQQPIIPKVEENKDEWIYRKEDDATWKDTFNNAISTLENPSETEERNILNNVWVEWGKNDTLMKEMAQYFREIYESVQEPSTQYNKVETTEQPQEDETKYIIDNFKATDDEVTDKYYKLIDMVATQNDKINMDELNEFKTFFINVKQQQNPSRWVKEKCQCSLNTINEISNKTQIAQ